jgi:hypothetical protein
MVVMMFITTISIIIIIIIIIVIIIIIIIIYKHNKILKLKMIIIIKFSSDYNKCKISTINTTRSSHSQIFDPSIAYSYIYCILPLHSLGFSQQK